MKWVGWNEQSFCLAEDNTSVDGSFDCLLHLWVQDDGSGVAEMIEIGSTRDIDPETCKWMLAHPNEVYMQELL